jgi:hypothetical protein
MHKPRLLLHVRHPTVHSTTLRIPPIFTCITHRREYFFPLPWPLAPIQPLPNPCLHCKSLKMTPLQNIVWPPPHIRKSWRFPSVCAHSSQVTRPRTHPIWGAANTYAWMTRGTILRCARVLEMAPGTLEFRRNEGQIACWWKLRTEGTQGGQIVAGWPRRISKGWLWKKLWFAVMGRDVSWPPDACMLINPLAHNGLDSVIHCQGHLALGLVHWAVARCCSVFWTGHLSKLFTDLYTSNVDSLLIYPCTPADFGVSWARRYHISQINYYLGIIGGSLGYHFVTELVRR